MKKGWQTKQLGELAELKGRIGWRGLTAKEYTKEGPLFLSVHSLNYGDYVDFRDAFHISEERYVESPEIMLHPNDVLICKDGAGIGKLGILGELPDRATINSSLLLIRSGKHILPKYLYRCLTSPYFQDIVQSRLNGATTPHLYQRDITEFPVVLPPLPEQQRIVGLLDEAFEGLATAKANAEKNLQNPRAIFESHLQSVFTQRGPGWVEKRLGDLCSIARGGSPRPIQRFLTTASDGFNWVKIGDATASGKYIYTTEQKIIREGATRSRIVHAGDFLLSNSMSFGRPYIMQTTGCVHDGWLVLSDYASQLDQDYLYLVLGSQFMFQQFDRLAAGSTVRNLNIELASRVEVPVPPLKQQREIAHHLDALSEETCRLARLYERKHAALEALKKSLLHQAFTGEL
jgi:type I restriction enzyme S subunit